MTEAKHKISFFTDYKDEDVPPTDPTEMESGSYLRQA